MTIAEKISARARAIVATAAAIAVLAFASPALAQNQPELQPPAATVPQQQVSQVQDQVRSVLTQYGRFVQHEKYGEVWVPTVTPQGWHPYPPCNWVNTKQYGWYYDDRTPWGQIVHHYGRWVHDAQMGWIWTPGSEFSPGWVVWRTSPQWVGWAPMLPDEDVQTVAATDFNNAAYWIFVETQKFAQGCTGTVAPAAQVPMLLTQTTYVTDIQMVGGIVVFVLPQYIVGPLFVIDAYWGPWPSWFLAQVLIDWNFIWNNLAVVNTVVYQNCAPKKNPPPQPISSPPPPAPPSPPVKPEGGNPPIVVVNPPPHTCPAGTVFTDGACRLPETCRIGLIRIGNECVVPRPDPKPPIVVINDPCARLSGGEFQRCIRGTPPRIPIDVKPTPHGPVGTAVGNQPNPGTDPGRHNPIGGSVGVTNVVKPNVIFHPNGSQGSTSTNVNVGGPSTRLPPAPVTPVRSNPNPVVLGAGSGGISKTTVGGPSAALNRPVTTSKVLPMALPKQNQSTIR